MKKNTIYLFFALFCSTYLFGQTYWQQEVNYTIQVKLNDKNHTLSAFEEFEYVNNSPNTLDKIYVHLWPNAYRNGNTALAKQKYKDGEKQLRFGKEEDKGGIDSLDFKSNGQKLNWEYDPTHIDICVITLNTPLKSGERIRISTPFKVKIPSGEISRLGHIDESYQITQWYPKPAVYDKNGWNAIPYLNQGEFYSEFGSFDVSITLPKNYVVGATGDLETQSEVEFLNNLVKSTEGKIADFLMTKQGRGGKTAFPASSEEWKTIRYTQSRVHDFAWFADKRFAVLKGEVELPKSKRKVTSWAMFVPHNTINWQHAIEYINDGTYYYSLWNGDYPYNQVTAVDGTISAGGGMEYPNVTVIGNASSKEELEVVIVHEVGHNWFYGILGSNERVHGWMDEGMNTLNEMRYVQTKYPNNTRLSDMVANGKFHFNDLDHHDMGDVSYRAIAMLGIDQPIETHSADFTPINYGLIMYQKTGLVFFYLMDYLGEEKFNQVMRTYYEEWKFKHPQPEDMRKSMEASSGKDLSWLFDDLIKTTNHVDYKLKSVKTNKSNNTTTVKVKNVGQVNGPIEVNAFKDTTLVETVWLEPTKKGEVVLKSTGYTRITIDDSRHIPEIVRTNNTWTKKSIINRIEPLKLEFLIGDNEASKTNLFWTPTIGGNKYDGFMLGAAVHNMGIPFKPFQFLVAPQFAFGRTKVAGIAELSYTFLPKKGLKISKFGASAKTFGIPNNGNFQVITPYWYAKLGNRGKAKATSHDILIQGMSKNFKSGGMGVDVAQGGAFARYNYNVNLPDHQFNMSLRGDYIQGNQKFDRLGRISASATYKFKYLKNKMERWVELRVFGAANVVYETQSFIGNPSFELSIFGARGNQDLFIEEYNFGRFEKAGLWSQNRQDNFGNFHANNADASIGNSDKWMASSNVYIQLPIKPSVFGAFADLGAFEDVSGATQTVVNLGLGVKLGNTLGVFFPLYQSSYFGDLFTDYGQKIRFTLKLNLVNKGLNLNNLLN